MPTLSLMPSLISHSFAQGLFSENSILLQGLAEGHIQDLTPEPQPLEAWGSLSLT